MHFLFLPDFFLKEQPNVLVFFVAVLPLENFKLNCVYFFCCLMAMFTQKITACLVTFFGLLSVDTKRRSGKKCNEGSSLKEVYSLEIFIREDDDDHYHQQQWKHQEEKKRIIMKKS